MFNVNQQEAIATNCNLAVVAGPGSGKSTVIVEKIGTTLRLDSKYRICAVTFTRDAANELPHKFSKKFPNINANKLCKFGTFHSICIQQLRDVKLIGEIATPDEQSMFINQAVKAASTKDDPITYEDALMRIEKAKCTLERDAELMNDPVVVIYEKMLKRNRKPDLYDVVRDTVLGLRSGKIPPLSIDRIPITHLMIDEFQDTDEVQYAWIIEHVKRGVITTVVADDDQTIYEWRRALGYVGLLKFIEDASAHKVVLGENYRCRAEILGHADNLIRHNAGNRIEKNLIAAKGTGGRIQVLRGEDDKDQSYEIAIAIEPFLIPCDDASYRFKFTTPQGSWCVIARNHILLNTLEAILISKGIKYQRTSGGFWKQYFLSVYLGLLKSLQTGNPSGIDVVLSIAGASQDSLDNLHKICGTKFHIFLDGKIDDFREFGKDDGGLFSKFSNLSKAWRSCLREGDYSLAIRGVASFIEDVMLSKQKDHAKRQSLALAQDILINYGTYEIQTKDGTREPSLLERIEKVLKPRKKEADGVELHTMHSCKGLEFDNVAVLDVSEGTMPNPERPDDINDRRLLYVAMTRAKEHLILTYKVSFASKFLQEAQLSINQ